MAYSNLDCAILVLVGAEKALREDPHTCLHRFTSLNFSGGFPFWDDRVDQVYADPANLEEALMALDLTNLLRRAIENQIAIIETGKFGTFGAELQIAELLRLVARLSYRDKLMAGHAKLKIASFCQIYLKGIPLLEFVETKASLFYVWRHDITGAI